MLLVTPILLIAGQPVELDRRLGGGVLSRVVASPFAAVVGNPFVGPALIPVLSAVLFFGPLPGWSVQAPAVAWVVALLATVVGCIIVLPVLDIREVRTSVVVGLAMTIGFFELLLDAIPGIVLRLQTHQASTFFDRATCTAGAPAGCTTSNWPAPCCGRWPRCSTCRSWSCCSCAGTAPTSARPTTSTRSWTPSRSCAAPSSSDPSCRP